jgi:hypothetical protein
LPKLQLEVRLLGEEECAAILADIHNRFTKGFDTADLKGRPGVAR